MKTRWFGEKFPFVGNGNLLTGNELFHIFTFSRKLKFNRQKWELTSSCVTGDISIEFGFQLFPAPFHASKVFL